MKLRIATIGIIFGLLGSIDATSQNVDVLLVHVSPDPSLHSVDVWMDSTKVADNLSFENSTKLLDITSGIGHNFYICDSGSIDTSASLLTVVDTFQSSDRLALLIMGLSDSSGFSNYQPLELRAFDLTSFQTPFSGYSGLKFLNAMPDATSLSVIETREQLGVLQESLAYGAPSGQSQLESFTYRLLFDAPNNVHVAEFDVPLVPLVDSNVLFVMTGFHAPNLNQGGPGPGLISLVRSGEIESYDYSTTRVQFIHNSSDPTIEAIDIYLDGALIVDDLAVRSASGYRHITSSVEHTISICPDSSLNAQNPFLERTVASPAGKTHVGMVFGNVSTLFAPADSLGLRFKESRLEGNNGSFTDVLFFHGISDLGSVSIQEQDVLNDVLFEDVDFGTFDTYLSFPLSSYKLDLIDSETEQIARFELNLSQYQLGGSAITLVSSGFADTSLAFGLQEASLWFARATSGKLTQLPLAVGVDESNANALVRIYPNPSSGTLWIKSNSTLRKVHIYSAQGQLVETIKPFRKDLRLELNHLSGGLYVIHSESDQGISMHRIMLLD